MTQMWATLNLWDSALATGCCTRSILQGLPASSGVIITSTIERPIENSQNIRANPLICPDCSNTKQFLVGSRLGWPRTPRKILRQRSSSSLEGLSRVATNLAKAVLWRFVYLATGNQVFQAGKL